jgi:hypothetical protein
MPLPLLIPAGIGAAVLLATGKLTLNAQGKIKKAKADYEVACYSYRGKYEGYKAYHTGTKNRLQKLGQARACGMKAVREAIAFIERARLVNPNVINDCQISVQDMGKLDQVYEDILKTLGGTAASLAGGAGVGALTAMGAYGLVGAFGTASTGTAIGSLSGAAATNSILAWFGGGSLATGGLGMAAGTVVLGGIFAAPAILALGLFTQKSASDFQKEVEQKIGKIRVRMAEIDRNLARLQAVRQRCDEVQRTVEELTENLKTALSNANASRNIEQDVYRVVHIAKALRAAIDEPVIPPNNWRDRPGDAGVPARLTPLNNGPAVVEVRSPRLNDGPTEVEVRPTRLNDGPTEVKARPTRLNDGSTEVKARYTPLN